MKLATYWQMICRRIDPCLVVVTVFERCGVSADPALRRSMILNISCQGILHVQAFMR
jgi:hypothetical protein